MKQARYASGTLGFTVAALAALGLPGCGLFGPPEPVNATHQGTLAAGDTVVESDGSFADDYPIRVEAGWQITAVMSAQGFDPYVWVIPPNSGGTTPPQQGSPPGTHVATITYTAAAAGTYNVRANSNTGGQSGAYTLNITAGPPGTAPAAGAVPAVAPATAPVPPPTPPPAQ